MKSKKERLKFRKEKVRNKIFNLSAGRPRLQVHRSSRYIYAQVTDDAKGITLVSASSIDKELKGKLKSGKNIETAKIVGELVGKRAVAKGVKEVCFDRGGLLYHGRIKALADAARKSGLKF